MDTDKSSPFGTQEKNCAGNLVAPLPNFMSTLLFYHREVSEDTFSEYQALQSNSGGTTGSSAASGFSSRVAMGVRGGSRHQVHSATGTAADGILVNEHLAGTKSTRQTLVPTGAQMQTVSFEENMMATGQKLTSNVSGWALAGSLNQVVPMKVQRLQQRRSALGICIFHEQAVFLQV
jgi:hypothetical protein